MEDRTKTFGQATALALTAAAASQEHATKPSTSSDDAHKRHFVQTFRRWAMLFKRADGDVETDKWLIAEYYRSLGHLSPAGFDALTERLKQTCTFFPTIRECLDAMKCDRYDWSHPFRALSAGDPTPLLRSSSPNLLGRAA